jgi:hypothetical protein
VTTNHLLLRNIRGKAVFSLPIAQPNSDFLGHNSSLRDDPGGGAGVSRTRRSKLPHR